MFGQVKFCSKCPVRAWVDVSSVILEPNYEFEVVGHETQFVRLEHAMIKRVWSIVMNSDEESIPLASGQRELGLPSQLPCPLANCCPLVVLMIQPNVIRLALAEPSETMYKDSLLEMGSSILPIASK